MGCMMSSQPGRSRSRKAKHSAAAMPPLMYRRRASSRRPPSTSERRHPADASSPRATSRTSATSDWHVSQIPPWGTASRRGAAVRGERCRRRAVGSPQAGSMAPKKNRLSSTERVSPPTVSSVVLNGPTPDTDQRSNVILWPTVPVIDAGIRIEPPVSDPRAKRADPAHRLTPAPDDEPPGMRWTSPSHGLRGVPQCGLMPTAP